MSRIEIAIRRSAETFRDVVWPHLGENLGGGELIPVETVSDSGFARLLDTLCMTDSWQLINETGMRALATRVQWHTKSWGTWTIRSELRSGRSTEYHKLTQGGDFQLPHYIIQAYVDKQDGSFISAAAIKTSDIQIMLKNGWHGERKPNPVDGNWFLPIAWSRARYHGFTVIEVNRR